MAMAWMELSEGIPKKVRSLRLQHWAANYATILERKE